MRPACLSVPLLLMFCHLAAAETAYPGTGLVDFAGYADCPRLYNGTTTVILGPHAGGRILDYSHCGKPAIPLNPAQNGYTWQRGQKVVDPYGGRFDIGPELTTPRHMDLWLGPWRAQFTGPREAVMISPVDRNTSLQLIRTFRLEEQGSHLRCTQKIRNLSTRTHRVCHWSRTFALGGGICLVPLNPRSRFPRAYLTYGPGNVMDFRPAPHENVRVRDGFLEIRGNPPFSKFMADPEGEAVSNTGGCRTMQTSAWLAYITPNDLMFVKRWPVYPQRAYGEMCAATLSLYYYPFLDELKKAPEQRPLPIDFCELEPIGPQEMLKPGQSASFTEDWWLAPYRMPAAGQDVDLGKVREVAGGLHR